MPERPKVFIGSSMVEFDGLRKLLEKDLPDRGLAPVMYDGASPEQLNERCQSLINSADFFVGIFGQRDTPGTYLEYDYASQANGRRGPKPCLIYIRNLDQNSTRDAGLQIFLDRCFYQNRHSPAYCHFKEVLVEVREKIVDDVFGELIRIHRKYTADSANSASKASVVPLLATIANERILASQAAEELRKAYLLPSGRKWFWGDRLDFFANQVKDWLVAMKYPVVREPTRHRGHVDFVLGDRDHRRDLLCRVRIARITEEDVVALVHDTDSQQYYKGWLVGERLIDPSAREFAKTKRGISVGSFDELIERQFSLGHYFNWLKRSLDTEELQRHFVNLSGHLLGTPNHRVVGQYPDFLEQFLDHWIESEEEKALVLLGEFGSGKSWTMRRLAERLVQNYGEALEKGLKRPRIPLFIELRDYSKPSKYTKDIYSLLANINWSDDLNVSQAAFEQLIRMGRLLLILDGFDEMSVQPLRGDDEKNIKEILKLVLPASKVILTCRTEHFDDNQYGVLADVSSAESDSPTPVGFDIARLCPLSHAQSQEMLRHRADDDDQVFQIMGNPMLRDLVNRPLFVDLLLAALRDTGVKPTDLTNLSQVFYHAIRQKLDSEIRTGGLFTRTEDKWFFLTELARDLYLKDKPRIRYTEFPETVYERFGDRIGDDDTKDAWAREMRGRTLLVHDEDGFYCFAHQALFDYFVALGMFSQMWLSIGPSDPPDGPGLAELYKPGAGSGGGYQRIEAYLGIAGEYFGRYRCSTDVLRFLAGMGVENAWMRELILKARDRDQEQIGYAGGNALTFLKLNNLDLRNLDLTNCNLKGADLSMSNLSGCNFRGANLFQADFSHCNLERTDFSYSNLTEARFRTKEPVYAQVWSPNGYELLVGGIGRTLRILNTLTINIEYIETKAQSDVQVVSWSRCGKYIACGTGGDGLRIWDREKKSQPLDGHNFTRGLLTALDLGDRGQIAIGGQVGTLTSDERVLQLVQLLPGIDGPAEVAEVVINYAGTQIALTLRSSKEVLIFDIETKKKRPLRGKRITAGKLCYTRDDAFLVACPASGEREGAVMILDLDRNRSKLVLRDSHRVYCAAVTKDNKRIITGGLDGKVSVWNLETGKLLHTVHAHSGTVRSLVFSRNDERLATASDDGKILIWDRSILRLKSPEPISSLKVQSNFSGIILEGAKGLSPEVIEMFAQQAAVFPDP